MIRNQHVGNDEAIQLGNLNARELNYLGNTLKKQWLFIRKIWVSIWKQLWPTQEWSKISQWHLADIQFVKNIEEQLLSSTRKLQLILVQLDLQFKLLISNGIVLRNVVLRPTLVSFDEMLHFKGILSGHLIDK